MPESITSFCEVSELPSDWQILPFEACVLENGLERKGSVQKSEYKAEGFFPVVDQGNNLVAGHTNDKSLVHSDDLPIILFGDDTRVFKFLDFPFVTGADGTKLFRANPQLVDPKFLYYALCHLEIPSRGYNRHFKYLKEQDIQAPRDQIEQQSIAAVLSKIQAAIEVQEKIVAALKELKAGTMAKLFREGLRGEPLKQTEIGEIPESWEVVSVDNAISIAEGQVDPRIEPYASMIHIGPENVEPDTGRLLECRTAREVGLISGKYLFQPGDIVYSKIRPYLRKAALADFTGICSADMYPLTPKESFDTRYLHALFLSEIFTSQAVSQQTRTGIPKLNREQLNNILVPKPSSPEQQKIGELVASISRRTSGAIHQLEALKSLFSSMLHLLMTGKVRLKDRPRTAGTLSE